jgi:hypothetical protein
MPTPPNVCDPKLYEKARNKYKNLRHSAYKSGLVVQEYKRLGGRYKGKKPQRKGLKRWFKEEWRNQDGEVGYKRKRRKSDISDIYRPTKRITSKTPTTYSELTKQEIKRARKEKATTGRVKRFKRLRAGDKKHDRTQAKLLRTCKRKLKRKEKLGFTCTAKLKSKGILPSKKKRKIKK